MRKKPTVPIVCLYTLSFSTKQSDQSASAHLEYAFIVHTDSIQARIFQDTVNVELIPKQTGRHTACPAYGDSLV